MTSLLFGHLSDVPVPRDENIVRMTTAPVEHDAPAAVQEDSPDLGEVETDDNPHLGMATRQLASHWVEGEQYSPQWIPDVDEAHLHNDLIDRQVSSSGTAAAREAAGQFGHGTLSYAVGIEPVDTLVDGHRMGNEYFAVDKPDIQETAGAYMAPPPGFDHSNFGDVSATGKANARDAALAGMYQAFLGGS